MYCLNLPSELQYLPENIFVVGLIPPPSSPDLTTISHILTPLVKKVLEFQSPGKQIVIYQHPESVYVQIRIALAIGDLGAIRKVGGFMSHSAHSFCSFCTCSSENLSNLDSASWTLHDSIEVRQQAEAWLNASNKKDKEKLASETGVRWTSLHFLPYWDPVKHLILGFLHNWLEGILEHQLRTLWGIGRHSNVADRWKEAVSMLEQDERLNESDIAESASELDELEKEQEEYEAGLIQSSPARSTTLSNERTPTPGPSTYVPMELDEEDGDNPLLDPNYIPVNTNEVFDLSKDELAAIHKCIQDVTLPTWIDQPPFNLGEAQHGKLKAHQYLILFTVIFPLVIPEIWWNPVESRERSLFESYYHLTAASNIICSFKTSNAEAELFTQHYIAYRRSIQHLFP
jgi:hypothetical protein